VCLEGIACKLWYNGVTTLGYDKIKIFKELNRRVLDIFEHRNIDEYFEELTMLIHTTIINAFI